MPPKAKPIPSKKELLKYYPKYNLQEAGKKFGVGQTLFFKWLKIRGIATTKKPRKPRSESHRKSISNANKGKVRPNRRKGKSLPCSTCGREIYLRASLIRERNYCSYECLGASKKVTIPKKTCPRCGKEFERGNTEAGNFRKKKYCSEKCAQLANPPPNLYGEDNPRWKGPDARRRNRHGPKKKWRNAVINRDKGRCQRCGTEQGVLVAHHIKPWETYPELRFEVSNGLTLCQRCHFVEHGWNISQNGIKETTDFRGVLIRKWTGNCLNCGSFIVKQASDMRRPDGSIRNYGFCSDQCKTKLGGKLKKGKPPGTKIVPLFEAYAARTQNS